MKEHKLGILSVALMYVGTIMGAGFASGREIWQFFGVFGTKGYIGVFVVGALFMIIGVMTSIVARKLKTNDMGRVIVPGNYPKIVGFVGYFMAVMLFTVMVTMSAAGGALFNQQFGLNRILGGVIITALVIITVIGGFDRVSRVFRFIMPILLIVVIGVCLMVIFGDLPPSKVVSEIMPSPLAPNWFLAAILYISYNILAVIPIVATASINAKSDRHAILGTALGGVFLAILAFILISAMVTDMNFSQAMDMPMLGFSARLSKVVNIIYMCVLLFAIYASATSNYYGFTTKLKPSSGKQLKIIGFACLGFAFGLVGFTNVVAYMFPIEGFLGIAIIAMVTLNFIRVIKMEKKSIFQNFDNHDRNAYPACIRRVTAGRGGEALMIFGSEKTALVDCGMAYCGRELVENIKNALGGRELDYILLSHTHYDHVGALPYVRQEWPEAEVMGAKHAKYVFERPGAIRTMKNLGEQARDQYCNSQDEILTKGLVVHKTLSEGNVVSLGDEHIMVLETPGHTDCSLTFVLEPYGIMFASESTGVLVGPETMHTAILKSFEDSLDSCEKCRAYGAKYIISPHYGMVPQTFNQTYWSLFADAANEKRDFVAELLARKYGEDEILDAYVNEYWSDDRQSEQPKEAFVINARSTIKAICSTIK